MDCIIPRFRKNDPLLHQVLGGLLVMSFVSCSPHAFEDYLKWMTKCDGEARRFFILRRMLLRKEQLRMTCLEMERREVRMLHPKRQPLGCEGQEAKEGLGI